MRNMRESTIRRIERFDEGLNRLKNFSHLSLDEIRPEIRDSIERNLQVCTEALIDIGRRIISEMNWRLPKDYKDTIQILWENRVIDDDLNINLKEIVGLRNLLVHLYASIDFSEIYGNLNKYIIFLEKGMKTLLKFCKDKNIDP